MMMRVSVIVAALLLAFPALADQALPIPSSVKLIRVYCSGPSGCFGGEQQTTPVTNNQSRYAYTGKEYDVFYNLSITPPAAPPGPYINACLVYVPLPALPLDAYKSYLTIDNVNHSTTALEEAAVPYGVADDGTPIYYSKYVMHVFGNQLELKYANCPAGGPQPVRFHVRYIAK